MEKRISEGSLAESRGGIINQWDTSGGKEHHSPATASPASYNNVTECFVTLHTLPQFFNHL